MARWRFNPADYATGTLPSVWAEEGASGFAYIEDGAWGRALRINYVLPWGFSSAATRALVFNPAGNPSSSVEIVAKIASSDQRYYALPAIRITSSQGTAYAVTVNDYSNLARIDRFNRPESYTTIGSQVSFDPGNAPFYVRIRHDGDYLYAKIWKEGTSEPSSWTWTIQDNVLLSGKLGILAPPVYSSSYIWLLWFGAATGSDKAPLDYEPFVYELSGASKVGALKLTADIAGVPVGVVNSSLKLTAPAVDGQANEVRDVSSSLKLAAPTTDGQANEVRDVSTSLALSPVAIAGQTLAETSDVQALLQLAGPRAFGYLISLTDLNVCLALGSPQVIANAFQRDYLWGRTRVSALKLAAGIENAGQAGGQLSAGPLKLLAQVYKVPAGVANVNLGAISLNARAEVLGRLTHANVIVDEAILLDTILAD